jgi:transmembrane 9 superfamily protein 2/4
MIIDNLPAAPKVESAAYETTMYLNDGFPVGFIDNGIKYVNNHINIEVHYHPVEGEQDKFRVVRFIVEPFSINHDFAYKTGSDSNSKDKWNPSKSQDTVEVLNTDVLTSCATEASTHTTFEMADKASGGVGPQEASGVVLFTYDVKWIEVRTGGEAKR